jgi:predicted Rossmann fold nucleotide-binding protein DprA/Smf involved in DNA uptake
MNDVRHSLGLPLRTEAASRRGQQRPESKLVSALAAEPATPDELAGRLGCAPEALFEELLELELQGIVARDRDGCLRIVAPELASVSETGRGQPLSSGPRRGGGRIW